MGNCKFSPDIFKFKIFVILGVYEVCTVVKSIGDPFYGFPALFGFFAPCFRDLRTFDAYRVCTASGRDNNREISCCAENPPIIISVRPPCGNTDVLLGLPIRYRFRLHIIGPPFTVIGKRGPFRAVLDCPLLEQANKINPSGDCLPSLR
jgi:hypothetical protein